MEGTIMTFEELIRYIEDKMPNFRVNAHGKVVMENLYKKYGYELIIECVDISAERYLEFDEDDMPIKESVENFFNKIGGIAYNKSLSPLEQKILHVLNYGNKCIDDWKWSDAKVLLKRYVLAMKKCGYGDEEIIDDLNDYVMLMIDDTCDWKQWYYSIEGQVKNLMEE